MTYIRVPVPRLSAGLASNLLGLVGLVLLVLAPGALTGEWAWTLVSAGLAGLGLSYLISAQIEEQQPAKPAPAGRHLKPAAER